MFQRIVDCDKQLRKLRTCGLVRRNPCASASCMATAPAEHFRCLPTRESGNPIQRLSQGD